MATDAGFSNVVASASGLATPTWTSNVTLNTSTTYYWRVWAEQHLRRRRLLSHLELHHRGSARRLRPRHHAQRRLPTASRPAPAAGPRSGTGNTWALSTANPHSGANHYRGTDPATVTDQRLASPAVALPVGENPLVLKFWHVPNLENSGTTACFDGGILEVTTNGGTTWTQVPNANLLVGPYTGAVSGSFSNPLAGLQAWCGPTTQPTSRPSPTSAATPARRCSSACASAPTARSAARAGTWTTSWCRAARRRPRWTLSSVDAAASQTPAPLAGLPLGALAASMLALGAGYALRRRQ